MKAHTLALLLFLGGHVLSAAGQEHSSFPIDVTTGPAPQLFSVDNQLRLSYELHLVNYAPFPVKLSALHITGNPGGQLTVLDSNSLKDDLVLANHLLGNTGDTVQTQTLEPGKAAVIFIDMSLEQNQGIPASLGHLFTFSFQNNMGKTIVRNMPGPDIAVLSGTAVIIGPPVKGAGWVAFNAYGGSGHRRSFNPVDGRLQIAERFAIDFMQVGQDGKLFHGEPQQNANFYGYGRPVLAVADATVYAVKDGLAEQTGTSEREKRVVTLDNIVGDYVILDLGSGRYAIYAHLQPGKITVRAGDRVKEGQVLGLLGNSGNSDEPHLHFQIMDKPSPLGAEGLPFVIKEFTQQGIAQNTDAMDEGAAWKGNAERQIKTVYYRQFPLDNAVIDLK
ncbi:hypothetical protein DCC81_08150 [Chitinophaga parva]|uniref:M23ase beta-sheet core domain-containing protein n=1 Tax=Chitinophaga parva TaxID=2169414 RepID=A0A2T7BP04_9BACT|nr:M23 family metallopeptidase [Chitinophaga parva]PUZ29408.1 hypothetical protein DCC81_08150 [Chitinophaga parva]